MTDYEFTGETDWKEVTASEGGIPEPVIADGSQESDRNCKCAGAGLPIQGRIEAGKYS